MDLWIFGTAKPAPHNRPILTFVFDDQANRAPIMLFSGFPARFVFAWFMRGKLTIEEVHLCLHRHAQNPRVSRAW